MNFKFKRKTALLFLLFICIVNNVYSLPQKRNIILSFDFTDTSNNPSNYEFEYRLLNKDSVELERGAVILTKNNDMSLSISRDVSMIQTYITRETDADSYGTLTYLYSDTGVLNITGQSEYKYSVVDNTEYTIDKSKSDDYQIFIKNKEYSDYNFVSIFSDKETKILEFIINKNYSSILLSDLLKADKYNSESGFVTESALIISGNISSLKKGNTYLLKVKSGKVNSYEALRFYNNYGYFGTSIVF